MFTDPISDMLTRIRNAVQAKKFELVLPYSKFKVALAKLFQSEGFISETKVIEGKFKTISIVLKYDEQGNNAITGIERVSKPGQRIYLSFNNIPRTNSGFGITVVSTSKGLMTDKKAKKAKIGGEIVCQIW